jgi:HSP20 family protein
MLTVLARLRDNVIAPFEAGIGLFPFVAHEIRIEQLHRNGRLVVRAELPGIDPDNSLHLAIGGGRLYLHVERAPQEQAAGHSEFRYGRLSRVVALPSGVIAESATARYERGVLEVSLAMGEPGSAGRRIIVAVPTGAPTAEAPETAGPATQDRVRPAPGRKQSPAPARLVSPGRKQSPARPVSPGRKQSPPRPVSPGRKQSPPPARLVSPGRKQSPARPVSPGRKQSGATRPRG